MRQFTRLGGGGAILGGIALCAWGLVMDSLEPGRGPGLFLFIPIVLGASLGAMTQRAFVLFQINDFKEAGMSSLVSVVCYLPCYLFFHAHTHLDALAGIVAAIPLVWVILLMVSGITMLIVNRF